MGGWGEIVQKGTMEGDCSANRMQAYLLSMKLASLPPCV